MRIFKNAWFSRFARRENIKDAVLVDAVARADRGVIDADLGGGVIKQRIARPGQGKSGGYRSIILFRKGAQAFFVYGFAKSDRENIEDDELEKFKILATAWFALSDKQIEAMMLNKALMRVKYEEK